MTYELICNAVDKLYSKYDEPDPFRLCNDMGIHLIFSSLGTDDDSIKGFYFESNRIKTITVNEDLPEVFQRIIVAHEIGHSVLHGSRGHRHFQEFSMLNDSSIMEREANLFAAEYLLDDDDVYDRLQECYSFFDIARAFYVPYELLEFKLNIMQNKGYEIYNIPDYAHSDFLKDCEVPDCDWWE